MDREIAEAWERPFDEEEVDNAFLYTDETMRGHWAYQLYAEPNRNVLCVDATVDKTYRFRLEKRDGLWRVTHNDAGYSSVTPAWDNYQTAIKHLDKWLYNKEDHS